ncbi:hypothetical protein IKB17_01275 [bacterium]|nr:hypothetical protein [bacterium]
MNKISKLRSYVNNGWNIENRKTIVSKIGKDEFSRIVDLARRSKKLGDVFEYTTVKDYFVPEKIQTIKNYFWGILDSLKLPLGNNNGIVYKKEINQNGEVIKKPVKVTIEQSLNTDTLDGIVYEYTMHHDGKEIGYVAFSEQFNLLSKSENLRRNENDALKDYPEVGVEGNRLIVTLLFNDNSSVYSGVGDLADHLAVEHCLKRGIEPNIVSEAAWKSHVPHFLRGKRFLPTKDGVDYNKVIKNLTDKRKKGEEVDTSDFGILLMYMPKEMIERLKKDVLEHPHLKYLLKARF